MTVTSAPISAVTGTVASATQSSTFIPRKGVPFNVSIGGGTSSTSKLERSFDGSNWFQVTSSGNAIVFTTSTTLSISEGVIEYEENVQYRLNFSACSGTVSYRFSQ